MATKTAERQERFMWAALLEALNGWGKTYPNPAVGAIVVKGKRIVGRGFHRKWGKPHAETEAMKDAGKACKGADLYVTLEPCCTYGRTPPCTDAIIANGIKRVYVAIKDPNPAVNGRGIRQLRRAGLDVRVGLLSRNARAVNETYFKYMAEGRPYVTLKIAQTLDGKIATKDGNSRWITSAPARALARRMRARAQAILVGVNTVINDDPMLLPVPRRRTHYRRCILDSHLSTPINSNMVQTAKDFPTVIYCTDAPSALRQRLERAGVQVKKVRGRKRGKQRQVDLGGVLADLASDGVQHLFVEGGGAISSSFLRAGLVDELVAFIAPKVLGDVNGLGSFANIDVKSLAECYGFAADEPYLEGEDVVVTLRPKRR